MKVYCVFSLESPHRGNSNVYKQYTIFIIKKKITPDYSKSAAMGFFLGTQERVRNSRGKPAISVPATEVLLYTSFFLHECSGKYIRRQTPRHPVQGYAVRLLRL